MHKAQEDRLLMEHTAGRIKATVLRLPDFYGPGVDKSFLSGAFTAAVRSGAAGLIGPIDRPHSSYSCRTWDRSSSSWRRPGGVWPGVTRRRLGG